MVKEYEGKGRGLVAAKDIKMGELILKDKAVLENKDFIQDGYYLTADADRFLLNQKILKDISLLNHSCAPNAEMGLLDGKKNKEPEKRFELRAIKNIAHTANLPSPSFFPMQKIELCFKKSLGLIVDAACVWDRFLIRMTLWGELERHWNIM